MSAKSQPATAADQQPDGTLLKGLTSQVILEILGMILAGKSLQEVLTSVVRVVESQRQGMLCSIWLLDSDGIHMRAAGTEALSRNYVPNSFQDRISQDVADKNRFAPQHGGTARTLSP